MKRKRKIHVGWIAVSPNGKLLRLSLNRQKKYTIYDARCACGYYDYSWKTLQKKKGWRVEKVWVEI